MVQPQRNRQNLTTGLLNDLRGRPASGGSFSSWSSSPCRNSPSQAFSPGRFSIRSTRSSAAFRARSSIASGAIRRSLRVKSYDAFCVFSEGPAIFSLSDKCPGFFRSFDLTRISHRFLQNGCNLLGNKELWDSAKYSLFLRCCSAETSKRQARDGFLGEKGQVLRKALRYTRCLSQRQLTLEPIASRIARCRCAR